MRTRPAPRIMFKMIKMNTRSCAQYSRGQFSPPLSNALLQDRDREERRGVSKFSRHHTLLACESCCRQGEETGKGFHMAASHWPWKPSPLGAQTKPQKGIGFQTVSYTVVYYFPLFAIYHVKLLAFESRHSSQKGYRLSQSGEM